MDWNLIVKLAPHLAWPIVALVALPFLLWKLSSLANIIANFQKTMKGLPDSVGDLRSLSVEMGKVKKSYETLQDEMKERDNEEEILEIALFKADEIEEQQAEKELEQPTSLPLESKDYREETKTLIQKAKNYLDSEVENSKDKRHKRTYKKIRRYNRTALAIAMAEREKLSDKQLSAAITIFSIWKSYERGMGSKNPVPRNVYDKIQEAWKQLQR